MWVKVGFKVVRHVPHPRGPIPIWQLPDWDDHGLSE